MKCALSSMPITCIGTPTAKWIEVAGGLGFEPRLAESESAVLPLDDPPVFSLRDQQLAFSRKGHVFQFGLSPFTLGVRGPFALLGDEPPPWQGASGWRSEGSAGSSLAICQ
jgi:hypothetical protein